MVEYVDTGMRIARKETRLPHGQAQTVSSFMYGENPYLLQKELDMLSVAAKVYRKKFREKLPTIEFCKDVLLWKSQWVLVLEIVLLLCSLTGKILCWLQVQVLP